MLNRSYLLVTFQCTSMRAWDLEPRGKLRKTAFANLISLAHLLLFLAKIFLNAPVPPITPLLQSPNALHGHPDVLLLLAVGTLCQVGSPVDSTTGAWGQTGVYFRWAGFHPKTSSPATPPASARCRPASGCLAAQRGLWDFTSTALAECILHFRATQTSPSGQSGWNTLDHPTNEQASRRGFHIDHAQLVQHASMNLPLICG